MINFFFFVNETLATATAFKVWANVEFTDEFCMVKVNLFLVDSTIITLLFAACFRFF